MILNDAPPDNTEYGVRWYHQPNQHTRSGHAHEVKRTSTGDVSIYTLEQNPEEPFTEGWYYCAREKLRGVEQAYRSNIVHITIAERVCKSFTKRDDKYGILNFEAALPGNYSTAECLGRFSI